MKIIYDLINISIFFYEKYNATFYKVLFSIDFLKLFQYNLIKYNQFILKNKKKFNLIMVLLIFLFFSFVLTLPLLFFLHFKQMENHQMLLKLKMIHDYFFNFNYL